MDYNIILALTHEHVVEKVKEAIQEGWVPLGGVTCCGAKLYQSMVKIERKVPPEGE